VDVAVYIHRFVVENASRFSTLRIPYSGWYRIAFEQGRAQLLPQSDQPGARVQGLAGQAAGDQQAGQLGQVAPTLTGQVAAMFEQFRVDFAGDQQRGKDRVPAQADRRVEQAIVADDALAFVPEQLTVAANIQLCLKVARSKRSPLAGRPSATMSQ
jgi:hypothetical protein